MKITELKRNLLKCAGYEGTDEEIAMFENDGTLTENTARNGKAVLWYLDEHFEKAIYIENGEELTPEEIKKQLL